MSNPTVEYNNYVRANLPAYITYDSTRNQYVTGNGKRFYTYKEAKWYCDYLIKFGSNLGYSVAGFTPPMVSDFINSKFFVGGVPKSFSETYEHTATTNGTMVDSDGLLKWRPHNLFAPQSAIENLVRSGPSSEVYTLTESAATAGRFRLRPAILTTGQKFTAEFELKYGVRQYVIIKDSSNGGATAFDLINGVVGSQNNGNGQITALGDGWYRCKIEWVANAVQFMVQASEVDSLDDTYDSLGGGVAFYYRYGRVYRSDLGGMVSNPDQPAGLETYVPTTTSAVYKPRRNHHIYNGSAWVNEGVLIESETRTNLVEYSEDFKATGWSEVGSTMTSAGTVVAPDGQSVTSWAFGDMVLFGDFGTTSAITYTGSIWIKANKEANLGFRTCSTNGADSIEINVTTEWVRYNVTQLADGVDPIRLLIDNRSSQGFYTADLELAFYGAQVEEGSTPSSYIPTSGSQVARAGEQLVIPHENISWPEPKVIGPELVTNGDFATDSDWTKGTGVTISAGVATWSASTGTLSQNISLVAGKVYAIDFDVSGHSSGGVAPRFTGGSPVIGQTVSSNGSYTQFLVAVSDETLRFDANGSTTLSIDNVSVKEIEPLALSIHMQGRMTYADTGIINETVFVRWAADSSNGIVLGIDTDGADTGQFKAYQAALGVADRVETAGDYFSPGINVPFNIASRHGSTFINGAVNGVALTENTTPTSLPDLENTNLELAYSGGSMVIKQFALWDVDIGDAGTEDATS